MRADKKSKAHMGHRTAVWIAKHINNYRWACFQAIALFEEMEKRNAAYNQTVSKSKMRVVQHKAAWKAYFLLQHPPASIDRTPITPTTSNPHALSLPFPLAISCPICLPPDHPDVKNGHDCYDLQKARDFYRQYYCHCKIPTEFGYTNARPPQWMGITESQVPEYLQKVKVNRKRRRERNKAERERKAAAREAKRLKKLSKSSLK